MMDILSILSIWPPFTGNVAPPVVFVVGVVWSVEVRHTETAVVEVKHTDLGSQVVYL
jgi:hypothetical protein